MSESCQGELFMKILLKSVTVIFALGMYVPIFSAETITKITYKWSDSQGIVQYTERPPANTSYEKITVTVAGGQEVIEVLYKNTNKSTDDTTQSALDHVVKANQRNCKIAKQNKEVLDKVARIRVTDPNGNERILSPGEKQTRLTETQDQIDIYCKDIRKN